MQKMQKAAWGFKFWDAFFITSTNYGDIYEFPLLLIDWLKEESYDSLAKIVSNIKLVDKYDVVPDDVLQEIKKIVRVPQGIDQYIYEYALAYAEPRNYSFSEGLKYMFNDFEAIHKKEYFYKYIINLDNNTLDIFMAASWLRQGTYFDVKDITQGKSNPRLAVSFPLDKLPDTKVEQVFNHETKTYFTKYPDWVEQLNIFKQRMYEQPDKYFPEFYRDLPPELISIVMEEIDKQELYCEPADDQYWNMILKNFKEEEKRFSERQSMIRKELEKKIKTQEKAAEKEDKEDKKNNIVENKNTIDEQENNIYDMNKVYQDLLEHRKSFTFE